MASTVGDISEPVALRAWCHECQKEIMLSNLISSDDRRLEVDESALIVVPAGKSEKKLNIKNDFDRDVECMVCGSFFIELLDDKSSAQSFPSVRAVESGRQLPSPAYSTTENSHNTSVENENLSDNVNTDETTGDQEAENFYGLAPSEVDARINAVAQAVEREDQIWQSRETIESERRQQSTNNSARYATRASPLSGSSSEDEVAARSLNESGPTMNTSAISSHDDNSTLNFGIARAISSAVQQIVTYLRTSELVHQYDISATSPISVFIHTTRSLQISPHSTTGGLIDELSSGFGSMRGMVRGSTYEQLLHELLMASSLRGSPPTSKKLLQKMLRQTKKIDPNSNELLRETECAVCKDSMDAIAKDERNVLEMPCKHTFCEDCIVPWLKKHNSCPICRLELATDDVEYEAKRLRERESSGPSTNTL